MTPSPEMTRRVAAAQRTLDEFKDQPFRLGVRDCVRMTAAHLRRLGHAVRLPPQGSYRSRKAALKLLAERGYADLAAALDGFGFERITPAAALVGDVVQMPAVDELGALAIVLTNGRVIGFHEDAVGAVVLQPVRIAAAWRIDV